MSKNFEGEPIKPNVDLLIEGLKLQIGDVVRHDDIADVSGVEYKSSRYRSVVDAWRKRLLREMNLDLQAVAGYGYRVLDDNERVRAGIKDFSQSVRRMGRSVDRMQRADAAKLDDNHRRQQDHAVRLTQAIVQSGRKAAKEIGFAGRVVSLPQRKAG